ncbi:MAG: InlB B-repeat-containing protein, partial [Bacteroidetes bacterium]|nr:InlB B-repeat-containing protein [Bacteroidota bacterium]
MKKIIIIVTIIGFMFSVTFLHAQHLFSVNQNDLSTENVTLLKNQIAKSGISTLSLTKNNESKDMYALALSSVESTQIVILNEQTGAHVVIIPAIPSTEFQLAPFFIEELRQGVLGNANHYLIMETTSDFSVKNIASVSAAKRDVHIPRYLYGPKENVKEALPKDRQIVHIFKEKPRLITIPSDDPEFHRYITQLEEEMSYYVYMYKLPDGGLWIYDEHFNIETDETPSKIGAGGYLEFDLTTIGSITNEQRAATEYALELWSEQMAGTVPVAMSVRFYDMGSTNVLGSATRMPSYWDPATQTWYCSAVGNQMAGYNVVPSMQDIQIQMNTRANYNYELGANPGSGRYDCVTVMLHEVAHGLGFFPLVTSDGRYAYTATNGNGYYTNSPGIFDRQLFQGLTGPCITTLTQSERAALTISNNLYAGAPGSNLLAANEGTRVRMYAPTSYSGGSSTSHWDNTVTNFQTFMKSSIGANSALHSFNTRKIGVLRDIGWTLPNNPNAIYVTFDNNGAPGEMPSQEFLPGVAKKLRANSFTRIGYIFTGWNTAPDGSGTPYTERQTITISINTKLYAQWQGITYTATFNANGGTVNPASKQVVYGSP